MQKPFFQFIAILFACAVYSQQTVKVADRSSWVDFQEYNSNPDIDTDEIGEGSLTLLADYQVNIVEQEVYTRFVNKITDNVGVQSSSNINATYDPLYEELIFHEITIIRDGKEIDKLNADHFQVIKRELNAESYLYDGALSAMLNLSDVRNGDIIDYSYTIKGFNPIRKGKFSGSYILNDYYAVGKVNVSITTKSRLNYKSFNTDIQPIISKVGAFTTYKWTTINPELSIYEDSVPLWKITMPTIVVSNYFSWEEVVDWAGEIYGKNETLNTPAKKKIQEIKESYKTQGERINATLDFVQNDIRYLGLEYGISGYKPNSPNKVLEQRYGDCKDKSLLMVHMLKEMDVEAYPMLISTSLKGTILDLPPSPGFFDHCVVKVIDHEKRKLYYDPTISNQGGTYINKHFPNYEYGLSIEKNNKVFDTIISSSNNRVTTLEDFNIEAVNGGATLNVTTTYTDVEADRMREYFKNSSSSNISKEYENYYADQYPRIKIVGKPVLQDDIIKNKVIVKESYAIDSIWNPMPSKKNYISIDFLPNSIAQVLYTSNMENRVHEIDLPYPVAREHITRITLPSKWNIEESNDIVSNDMFYYDYTVDYDQWKRQVEIKSYLKIQKPTVTPSEFNKFQKGIVDLEKTFGFTIMIPTSTDTNLGDAFAASLGKIFMYLIFFAGFIIFLVWIINRKKKTDTADF